MRRLRIFLPPGIDGRREGLLSFWKAEQLLALATMVSARHSGITLDDVIARFNVSKRTAQRMLRALESQFSDASTTTDSEGRKRWHLPSGALRDLMSLSPEELAVPCRGFSTPRTRRSAYDWAGEWASNK
jgi:predicted DNA-binding transcriptional regulator YafY